MPKSNKILSKRRYAMQIIPLRPADRIQMKKPHPCGSNVFVILRVGSEVRIKCEGCGRDVTVDRLKLEKSIRRTLPSPQTETEPRKE